MIDFTVRASNDFDIGLVDCDNLNTVCPSVGWSPITAVWSSTAALDASDTVAFLFMDNASTINLPSISSPSEAFDAADHYHELHVLTDTQWQACETPGPPDATCLTNSNLLTAGNNGHALFKLDTDLNTLAIGDQPQFIIKDGITDRTVLDDAYQVVWVVKVASDHTTFQSYQNWSLQFIDPC